jgi:segregation and condensation protein B
MDIVNSLEAILFVSDSPVPLNVLARTLECTEGQAEQALEVLAERLERSGSLQLTLLAGGYQISTKPDYAELVAKFLQPQKQRLSRSLMEVLAIVAYKQPITMAEVDQVRGVQSDYGIRGLLERRLIEEVGRKPVAGRPSLYGTTGQFLHQFKMNRLEDLPQLNTDLPVLVVEPGGLAEAL